MFRAGGKLAGDRPLIDGVTAHQVAANAHLSTDELVARMAAAGPRQARWRTERPILRRMPMKNQNPDGTVETWTMGYVFEVILTRDTWMHRVDVAQRDRPDARPHARARRPDRRRRRRRVGAAARQAVHPGADRPRGRHVHERDRRRGLTCDAIEFCRTLAGRAPGTGLLAQRVPF